jgi:hypothetical protein
MMKGTPALASTGLVLLLGLAGCTSGASSSGSSTTSAASTTTSATTPPPSHAATPTPKPVATHVQGKLAGVPKQCPSADDVTLAVHRSLPHVNQTNISSAVNCTYYVNGSKGSPGLNMTFGRLPRGTTVASYQAALKTTAPSAVFVPGVGDGAFYYSKPPLVPSALNFFSGGTSCAMYTSFPAGRAHLVALAVSILEG